MKTIWPVTVLLVCLVYSGFTSDNRIAVADFTVHSDNPKYKFMGKGISEMIAVELRKSPEVTLIDREKRVGLLEEMEISLSDMGDPDTRIEVGRLLAASHLIYGELIEMGGPFLISLRMTEIASGEVVWNETLSEILSKYDYISGFFAASILTYLDAQVASSTVVKKEVEAEKAEEVVVAFSKAIDHYDRKDTEQAKRELTVARKLDPESEAVTIYLNKLTMNTSKFRVESTRYAAYQNPAYLPMIKSDRLLVLINAGMPSFLPNTNTYDLYGTTVSANEHGFVSKLGYSFPLGKRSALGAEVFWSSQGALMEDIINPGGDDDLWVAPTFVGGLLASGLRFSDNISMGVGAALYQHIEPGEDLPSVTRYSAELGFLIKNDSGSLVFDTRAMYTSEEYPVPADVGNWKEEVFNFFLLPITWENTLTVSPRKNLFLVLKQINYIFLESDNFTVDLIPAAEYWFLEGFSIRGGIDGKYLRLGDRNDWALGGILGASLKLKRFYFDANVEYRSKPYYLVPEERYSEFLFSLTFGTDGLFVKP